MRGSLVLLVIAMTMFVVMPSVARADDDPAVQLTTEAAALFSDGRYADALDRYQRADALVRRQTIVLRVARCLEKLGRLVEAASKYESIAKMELSPDLEPRKRQLQEEAVTQAAK